MTPRLSREAIALLVHRTLDRVLSPLGVWLMRRTKGGVTRRYKVDALVLTTVGRRTQRRRSVVLQYFPDGDELVVVAANDGSDKAPAWYLNLRATPDAEVEVLGRVRAVRATELRDDEAAIWWQRILARAPAYGRYARATSRRFPVLRLSPIA